MQVKYDSSKFVNFNFYDSQISDPWMNKKGIAMVSIKLPNYIKKNLGIPENCTAKFNVAKSRVFGSKFDKDKSYTKIGLERDVNIYVGHKNENGDYTNEVNVKKGEELYNALKDYKKDDKENPNETKNVENNSVTKEEYYENSQKEDSMVKENPESPVQDVLDELYSNPNINLEYEHDDIEF